jgi:hypothetical protein
MHPLKLAIAAGPLAALAFAAPASATTTIHQTHQKQFAICHAQGQYAICDAAGNVNYPLSVVLHVTSSPRQQVSGAWGVTCSKGMGTGGKSGNFSGRTPYKKTLRLNYKRPDNCVVSANAQLASGGTVTVRLVAWKR